MRYGVVCVVSTGAGKSTLTSALFRLVELSGGAASFDGTDLSALVCLLLPSLHLYIITDCCCSCVCLSSSVLSGISCAFIMLAVLLQSC
jgi:ABC-type cobalamin/Fe3+-siderophores transport system ATPase subunit